MDRYLRERFQLSLLIIGLTLGACAHCRICGRWMMFERYTRQRTNIIKHKSCCVRLTTQTMSESKRQGADLQRHYSTIGIGDVFVEGLPPHPLPSVYLDPNLEKQPSSFLSREIVGDIKVSPEDFVVREIGLSEKTIPGWKEEQWESVRVADLTSWNAETKKIIQTENSLLEGESGKEQNTKSDTATIVIPPETSQNAPDLSALVDEDILNQLKKLHQTAREELIVSAKTQDGKHPRSVAIHLDDKSSTSAAQDRGALHQAIRDMFPLLLSETKSDSPTAVEESTTTASKRYRIDVTIDTRFAELMPYLHFPDVDVVGLYTFYKRGYEATRGHRKSSGQVRNTYPSLTDPTCSVLRLRADLPRDERKNIHEIISRGSNRLFVSFTTPDYPLHENDGTAGQSEKPTTAAVIVRWHKGMENRLSRKRKHCESGACKSDKKSSTYLFVLKKQGKEHLAAIRTIAEGLRCGQSDIGLAGIKDMNAITYQFCTITGVAREKIRQSKNFFRNGGMEVGEPVEVGWRLEKGDLQGNRFEIALRNVQRVFVQGNTEECVPLDDVSHLKDMVDRVSRSGFVNFYGEQRVGIPGVESIAGVRAFDIGRAMLQQDFGKAVDLLMTGRRFIHGNTPENPDILRFRETWKNTGGDPKKSWKALPRGNTLLRERTVLRGLKRYGTDKPLEAFQCLHRNERSFFVSAYQSYVWNLMATERLLRLGYGAVEGDLVQESNGTVKYITEDMSAWKIDDVVLPLPGSCVLFPRNAIGDLYRGILEKDKVLFLNDAPEESTAKGSYRRLIAKAKNIEWKPRNTGGEKVLPAFTISFDLPKGCYATACLRELMMTTIDRVNESATEKTEM